MSAGAGRLGTVQGRWRRDGEPVTCGAQELTAAMEAVWMRGCMRGRRRRSEAAKLGRCCS